MLKRDRRAIGVALVASAAANLLAQCCKKEKDVSAALTVFCAAEGILGLYLLDEDKTLSNAVKAQVKRVADAIRVPVGIDEQEEIFESDEDIAAAEEAILDELATDEQI